MKPVDSGDLPKPPYHQRRAPPLPRLRPRRPSVKPLGTWKVAYADFVTALMAFFLLMWIIIATDHVTHQGIADYFATPLFSASVHSAPSSSAPVLPPSTQGNSMLPLQQRIAAILTTPALEGMQVQIDTLTEGLRLQITDAGRQPMFDSASAQLRPAARQLLQQLAHVLSSVDNPLSIAGHTDAAPYVNSRVGNLGNWELSSQRASAALKELQLGGLDGARVVQVVGHADRLLLDAAHPTAAINRRISILVLTPKAAQEMLRQQRSLEVQTEKSNRN